MKKNDQSSQLKTRLVFILLCCCSLAVSAKAYPQKISLHLENVPLPAAIARIQAQTTKKIVYNEKKLQQEKPVSLDVKEESLENVLSLVLKNTNWQYKEIDATQIAIVPSLAPVRQHSFLLTGNITDDNGRGLDNVTILEQGTNNAAVSDTSGRFQITLNSENAVLQISRVGYETKEVGVNGRHVLTMSLVEKQTALNEVVVVGYGTQKKKDITGAIAVVSDKVLEDRPNIQFGDALEGKAAGVQVIKPSGQPQAGFSIRIRGTSSITSGSEPLYIVDGVPTSSISEINPADISGFSILKDAASAAIYGASGANGVVLITTKKGGNGESVVNFESYYGFSAVRKRIPTLNSAQYYDLMRDMGKTLDTSLYNAHTNWQDELFRNGTSQNYYLSVRGGTAKTSFYISSGWVKQNGVVISNTMNRANFTVNIEHTISKIFKAGVNAGYNRWYDVNVTEGSRNSVLMNTLLGAPVIRIWDDAGKQFTSDPFYQDLDNPVGLALGNKHSWVNNRFLGNIHFEANIAKGLKARTMFGYEHFDGKYTSFVDPYQTTEGRGKKGIGALDDNTSQYWISENTISYDKQINKNSFAAVAGFIAAETTTSSYSLQTRNFANANVTTPAGGSIVDPPTSATTELATSSLVSRLTYNYDEKYIVSANFRTDASTVFGPNKRWGYFPAFSAAWRVSGESFFRNIKAINDFKIRASWGKVGNSQIGAYSYLGQVGTNGSYVIGDNVVPGYTLLTLPNYDLKWESTQQTDIGIDLSVLNNRITVTSDYYDKKTGDLLLQVPVPSSSGYTTSLQNVGKLQNKGFEFTLGSKNLTGTLKWNTELNFSLNRNKVLFIDNGTIFDGAIPSRDNATIAKAGLPLGSFWGYVAKGVDPRTGNMLYQMADTAQGLQTSDRAVIGNPNPRYVFGITNILGWKDWAFSFFFQGVQGNDILNATRIASEGMWQPRNQTTAVLQRWKTPGQITSVPKPDLNNPDEPQPNYNSLISSRFIEKGSYVRLKSVTLSYTLKGAAAGAHWFRNIKLYATAENLFTFTKYSGYDPEVNAYGSSNTAQGIDYGSYPQTRNFIVGLNATF